MGADLGDERIELGVVAGGMLGERRVAEATVSCQLVDSERGRGGSEAAES